MKKLFFYLVGSLVIVLNPVSKAENTEVRKILNEIQQKIQSLNSYQAKLEMVFLQSKGGVMEINGEIKFVKPDKLKMEIGVKGEEKTKQYMYSDGVTLWQYMPFFKLASKVDLASLKKEFPNAGELVKGQSNLKNPVSEIEKAQIKYLGEEELDGEKVYVFEGKLTPERKEEIDVPVEISKVKVWVSKDDGLQRKAEFYSPEGELVFYQRLKDVNVNIEIPDNVFEFEEPEGVNILDSTPQAREMLKKKQIREKKEE